MRDPVKQAAVKRKHYEANRELIKSRAREFTRNQRLINRDFIRRWKEERGCMDCGGTYPSYVLQFDHRGDDKEAGVAAMVNSPVSLLKLIKEIEKCDVVCANCHAERTHTRKAGGRQESQAAS